MKLDAFNDKSVETTEEEFESLEFGIDSESLGVLFKGFSDSLYSNKIGSIVREITSNCFDSHVEAGITRDVEIEMVNENFKDSQALIIFRDFGVGLSPERVRSVYSRYFSSTKRATNDQIGGFGIGSKSPLSYSDIFTVVTVYGGIEYTYLIHRGLSVPEIKLLEKKETTRHNGTEVIITIKNYIDKAKFITELKKQLWYFEGITYINCGDIKNDYKIYSTKTFLYRPGCPVSEHMHVVIGRVAYPIDFSQLDLYGFQHDVQVAIKLEIGDITVTMNREQIEYTESTTKLLIQKIKEVKEELQELYDRRVGDTDDISVPLKSASKITNNIILDDGTIIGGGKIVKAKPIIYTPFKDIRLNTIFEGDVLKRFLEIRCKVIRSGDKDIKVDTMSANITSIFIKDSSLIYRTNTPIMKRKSYYIADLEGSAYWVVALRKDWESKVQDWSMVATMEEINLIRTHLLKYVIAKTKSYDKVEIAEEWLKEYLDRNKEVQAVYKDNTKVHIRLLSFNNTQSYPSRSDPYGCNYTMKDVRISDLANHCKRGGIIVYTNYNDTTALENAGAICGTIPHFSDEGFYGINFRHPIIMFMKVSKETSKKLEFLPNTVVAEKFTEKYKKLIIRTLCAAYVHKHMGRIDHYEDIGLFKILPEWGERASVLREFSSKYYKQSNVNNAIVENISKLSIMYLDDLQYRYFEKSGNGADVYNMLFDLLRKLKPLTFLDYLDTHSSVNNEPIEKEKDFMSHFRDYLIKNKVFIKTS